LSEQADHSANPGTFVTIDDEVAVGGPLHGIRVRDLSRILAVPLVPGCWGRLWLNSKPRSSAHRI